MDDYITEIECPYDKNPCGETKICFECERDNHKIRLTDASIFLLIMGLITLLCIIL